MRNIASSRILHLSDASRTAGSQRPWIWPLPRLDGITPAVLSLREHSRHDGAVELGYRDRGSSPSFVPVFAAQDGVISFVTRAGKGATLCLDHAGGWSTQYGGLAHALVLPTDRFRRRRKTRVRAGDVLGHAPRESLRISFALSQLSERGWIAIDPAPMLHAWSLVPWFADPPPRTPAQLAA